MLPIRAINANTTLEYSLVPVPFPLTCLAADTANLSPAVLPESQILLVITNPSASGSVSFDKIEVRIPFGDGAGDLTNDESSITGVVSPSSDFSVSPIMLGSPGEMALEISGGSLAGDSTITLEISFIVNTEPGLVSIGIREFTSDFEFTSAALETVKLPWGFDFDNLQVVQNGQVVGQVPYNTAVELQWDSSAVDLTEATFTVSMNGGPPQPVTTAGSFTTPALTTNTAFVLEATVTQANGQSVSMYLTANVAVTNPDLTVTSLNAIRNGTTGGGVTAFFVTTDFIGGDNFPLVLTSPASFLAPFPQTFLVPQIPGTSPTYMAGTSGFIIVNIAPIGGTFPSWTTVTLSVIPPNASVGSAQTYTVTGINTAATGTGIDLITGGLTVPVCFNATFNFTVASQGQTIFPLLQFIPLGIGTAT